jgi:hypothetical protein
MDAVRLNLFGTYLRSLGAHPSGGVKKHGRELIRLTRRSGGKVRYPDLWTKAYLAGYSEDEFVTALSELVRRDKLRVSRAGGPAAERTVFVPDRTVEVTGRKQPGRV